MSKTVTLTTNIDADLKEALVAFCKRRGIKIQHFVETAIAERLEDEIDLEDAYNRRNEEAVPFEDIISKS